MHRSGSVSKSVRGSRQMRIFIGDSDYCLESEIFHLYFTNTHLFVFQEDSTLAGLADRLPENTVSSVFFGNTLRWLRKTLWGMHFLADSDHGPIWYSLFVCFTTCDYIALQCFPEGFKGYARPLMQYAANKMYIQKNDQKYALQSWRVKKI